jgi:outer membrane biogenesis lipoprotein LolB
MPPPRSLRLAPCAAALLAAACARVPPANLSRDPALLAQQLRAVQAKTRSVKGSARVDVTSPGLSGTVAEFVAAEKPDRVHLETLDFFGNPAAVLVAAGGRFAFLDARAGVLYRGDATPENVSRLLPVVVPIDELVTILCGSAPLLPGEPVEVTTEGELVVLALTAPDAGGRRGGAAPALVQRLGLGEEASVAWSRLRRVTPGDGGRGVESAPAYDLDFGLFERVAGLRFPTRLVLDAPAARSRVALHWREDLEVNATLDAGLFQLATPKGVREIALDRGAPVPAPVDIPMRRPSG